MKTALETWFASARPNDTFCYHVGTNLTHPQADEDVIAAVRRLYDTGEVELVQRLVRPRHYKMSSYEHLVVKREVRDRRPILFGERQHLDMAA